MLEVDSYEFRCHECYIRARLPDFIDLYTFDHAFDVAVQHLIQCIGPIYICWRRVDGKATRCAVVDRGDDFARDVETRNFD